MANFSGKKNRVLLGAMLLSVLFFTTELHAKSDLDCPGLFARIYAPAKKIKDKIGEKLDWFQEKAYDYTPEDRRWAAYQYLNHFIEGPGTERALQAERALSQEQRTFLQRGGRFVVDGTKSLGSLLSPIPFPRGVEQSALQRVFLRLWKNPEYTPTGEDLELLKKTSMLKPFLAKKEFFLVHPNAMSVRKGLGVAGAATSFVGTALLYLNAGMAMHQASELEENTSTFDDYLEQENEDEDGKQVVQILTETTPFPHSALRIGHRVYSYGVKDITSSYLSEYVNKTAINSAPTPSDTGPWNWILGKVYGTARMGNVDLDKKLERSIRVTNLNLTKKQIEKIQAIMERNTGKQYANRTGAHDCMTMLKKILEENSNVRIPWLVDALPSVSSSYLSLLKSLGNESVGVTQMVIPKGASKNFHLKRNTYIAMMEGKFALANWMFAAGIRGYMDLAKSPEEIEYYPEDVKAELVKWRKETREGLEKEFKELLPGKDFFGEIEKIKNPVIKKEKINAAKSLVEMMVEGKVKKAQEKISFSQAQIREVTIAAEEVEALGMIRADLLSKLDKLEKGI